MLRSLLFLLLSATWLADHATADLPQPRARWKLAGDAAEVSGKISLSRDRDGWHGSNQVAFDGTGPAGIPKTAAKFVGRGDHLRMQAGPQLARGKSDFSVSLWAHTEVVLDDDLGDIISHYDRQKRCGWQMSLRNHAGVTNNQANYRQLQFGIDNATTPQFRDEGRPGNSVFGMSLAAHDGALYVGTCEPELNQGGRVYRYRGPGKWDDLGAPVKCNAVSAMAAFHGSLYVGTARYRLVGSVLPESKNQNIGGQIYRLDPKGGWILCGQLPDTDAVGGMVVYRGKLYASAWYRPAGFFRYDGDTKWTRLPTPEGQRIEALGVYNSFLWASNYDVGHVYRFDGNQWLDMGQLGDNTQTYSFATHEFDLCVGTWKSGRVFRYGQQPSSWHDCGRLGNELEVMGMLVHNGQLYAGTLPSADVYRFDGDNLWTRVGEIDKTVGVKYRRAWTAAAFQGRLFWTTLPSGRIHSMKVGACVTHDRELPAGWHHIVAVKEQGRLKLYVDGVEVARSDEFDPSQYDLTTAVPLLIGAGAGDSFNGLLSDVAIYSEALSPEQIRELFQSIKPLPKKP